LGAHRCFRPYRATTACLRTRESQPTLPIKWRKSGAISAGTLTAELDLLDRAWDIVWWRRLAYFATLITTIFVGLFFAALVYVWPNSILDWAEKGLVSIVGEGAEASLKWVLQKLGSGLDAILPGWLAAVLPEVSKYPLAAVVSVVLLGTLFFVVSSALQGRIAAYAEWGWADQKGLPAAAAPAPNWMNAIAHPGRKVSAWCYRVLWLGVFVNVVGFVLWIITLIVLTVSSPIWVWRELRRRPWMA